MPRVSEHFRGSGPKEEKDELDTPPKSEKKRSKSKKKSKKDDPESDKEEKKKKKKKKGDVETPGESEANDD